MHKSDKEFWETLDRPCWRCGGSGQVYDYECGTCDGSGFLLSEAGTELIKFVARHQKKLKEIFKVEESKKTLISF